MSAELAAAFAGRRALVTGGLGFIGSRVARRLVGLGAEVSVIDALIHGCGGNWFNLDGVRDRVQVQVADVREHAALVEGVAGRDYLFNLARQFNLQIISIEQLIRYRRISEKLVYRTAEAALPTRYGDGRIVAYGGLEGEKYWYDHTNVWENERLMRYVPRFVIEPASIRRPKAPDLHYNHFEVARHAKQLRDLGVSVHIGAHGQREGLGAHWEMWMMQQGGFTPWEALRAGTIDGARYLGMDASIGSIEKGKLADLIVLDRNPLENIRNTESIRMVMLNGRLYDATTLNEIGNHPRERMKLYWER